MKMVNGAVVEKGAEVFDGVRRGCYSAQATFMRTNKYLCIFVRLASGKLGRIHVCVCVSIQFDYRVQIFVPSWKVLNAAEELLWRGGVRVRKVFFVERKEKGI